MDSMNAPLDSMNATIRRLTMTFIILLLIISGIAAYVQVGNQAFFNGPALTTSQYAPPVRNCPPYDAPLRGTIYDRNGVPLVWTQADPNASPCGYKRVVSTDAVNAGLGPLLGYFSYQYGTAGLEATYNDYLAGIGKGTPAGDVQNKILHKPRYGNDLYLSIDLRLQQKVNAYYDSSAVYAHSSSSPCQPAGTSPPGGMVVEDPNNGQVLALVSRPSYDPNKISDPKYWQQINSDPNAPLLNHATQGLYVPGSTFKTVTLIADLDANGADITNKQYDQDAATHFKPYGFDFQWVDYTQKGEWQNIPNLFPMSLEDGYAYSDNTIYARAAIDVGKDNWLKYVERFGIAVPGVDVPPVTFDAPYSQSRAYPATTNGQPTNFDPNLLAASGFGQGDLLITPLTMAEITSAVANGGIVYDPHVVMSIIPHVDNDNGGNTAPKSLALPSGLSDCGAFNGLPCNVPTQTYNGSAFSSDTAAKVRAAMWAVTSYGTGVLYRNGVALADQPIKVGGKTGTGENGSGGIATTWWISLAQDDQAPSGGPAQVVTVLEKDKSGEGACQVYVAYDTFETARQLNYLKV